MVDLGGAKMPANMVPVDHTAWFLKPNTFSLGSVVCDILTIPWHFLLLALTFPSYLPCGPNANQSIVQEKSVTNSRVATTSTNFVHTIQSFESIPMTRHLSFTKNIHCQPNDQLEHDVTSMPSHDRSKGPVAAATGLQTTLRLALNQMTYGHFLWGTHDI